MAEQLLRRGEALDYIEETYGVRLSYPTLHRYVRIGRLRGVQPGGTGAWWLVSKESIDELFGGSREGT